MDPALPARASVVPKLLHVASVGQLARLAMQLVNLAAVLADPSSAVVKGCDGPDLKLYRRNAHSALLAAVKSDQYPATAPTLTARFHRKHVTMLKHTPAAISWELQDEARQTKLSDGAKKITRKHERVQTVRFINKAGLKREQVSRTGEFLIISTIMNIYNNFKGTVHPKVKIHQSAKQLT